MKLSKRITWVAVALASIVVIGTTTALFSAAPSSAVVAPQITQIFLDEALKTLDSAGIKYQVIETSSERAKGQVVNQDPRAGEIIKPGQKITLLVSNGISPTPPTATATTSATTTPPKVIEADSPSPERQQTYVPPSGNGVLTARSEAERKLAVIRQILAAQAAQALADADARRIADEAAVAAAAEQARINALRNERYYWDSQVAQTRGEVVSYTNEVNTYAARGTLQSGWGNIALSNLATAQARLEDALINQEIAIAAEAAG